MKHSFIFPVNLLFIMYQNDDVNISTKYVFVMSSVRAVSSTKTSEHGAEIMKQFCILTIYFKCPLSDPCCRLYTLIMR